jgi:hypothetical protein
VKLDVNCATLLFRASEIDPSVTVMPVPTIA